MSLSEFVFKDRIQKLEQREAQVRKISAQLKKREQQIKKKETSIHEQSIKLEKEQMEHQQLDEYTRKGYEEIEYELEQERERLNKWEQQLLEQFELAKEEYQKMARSKHNATQAFKRLKHRGNRKEQPLSAAPTPTHFDSNFE